MLHAAIENNRCEMLGLLLTMYPTWNNRLEPVMSVHLPNLDLDILKVLHSYEPEIIHIEFEPRGNPILAEVSMGSDPRIPTYLLDHGADVRELKLLHTYALTIAVRYKQPFAVIQKMVECGADIGCMELQWAILRQDATILHFLLNNCQYNYHYLQPRILELARKIHNPVIVSMVESRGEDLSE